MKNKWYVAVAGLTIGIGCIAPGLSGGALAVAFGIYRQMADDAAHPLKDFRGKLCRWWPLALGAVPGVLLCGRLIEYSFAHFPLITAWLFIGMMCGTLPQVWKDSSREGIGVSGWISFTVGGGLSAAFGFARAVADIPNAEMTFPLLLLSGATIAFGIIVPGISCSFILLSLGWYGPLLTAFNELDVPRLLPIALGAAVAALCLVKLVSYLFATWYRQAGMAVFGLLVGSLIPFIVQQFPLMGINAITAIALATAVLGSVATGWLMSLSPDKHS